jgi:hypothetical protein
MRDEDIEEPARLIPLAKLQSLREARNDAGNGSKRAVWILDAHRLQPELLCGIVVAAGEDGIPNEHHLLERDAAGLAEPLQPVRLVHPLLRDVDRRRAAHVDRELRQPLVQIRLDHLAFRKLWVPLLLLRDGRLLAKRREGDLAAAVLDPLSPSLLRLEPRRLQRSVKRLEDLLPLGLAEKLRVRPLPLAGPERVQLRPRRRHEPQPRQVRARRQPTRHLLLKLRPVAARDDRNVGHAQQLRQRRAHRVLQRLLALRERAVEIEPHERDHLRIRLSRPAVEQPL